MYRLIIADDEAIECRALEHKIQSMVDEVMLLPSVYDGVSLIKSVEKYHPDIAIVDINMPGLNGLEAIEHLKMKRMDLKIIINSSYSDFMYMQKALQLGASDYLLKPGNKETLAETIRTVCRQLDQEKSERDEREREKKAAGDLYQLAADKWMQSLLLGIQDDKCLSILATHMPEVRQGGYFTAWKIVSEEGIMLPTQEKMLGVLKRAFGRLCGSVEIVHGGILYFFLAVRSEETRNAIDYSALGTGVKCEHDAQKDEADTVLLEILDYARRELRKEGVEAIVGVSRRKSDPDQFVSGFQEAKVALQGRQQPGISIFRYHSDEKITPFFEDLVHPLAILLVKGEVEECVRQAGARIPEEQRVVSEDMDIWRIQSASFLLDLEKETRTLTGRLEEGHSCWLLWNGFSQAVSPSGLSKWLSRGIRECYVSIFNSEETSNIYIEKAMLYIMENYGTDISLEDTANACGISSFYLSRLFKQEKDLSFIELLTDIRIRKAVQMMRDNEKTIKEISQSTGYSSITYFYRVFKKTTGLTVGMMKKYLS